MDHPEILLMDSNQKRIQWLTDFFAQRGVKVTAGYDNLEVLFNLKSSSARAFMFYYDDGEFGREVLQVLSCGTVSMPVIVYSHFYTDEIAQAIYKNPNISYISLPLSEIELDALYETYSVRQRAA